MCVCVNFFWGNPKIPSTGSVHDPIAEVPATSTCSSSPSAHSACLPAPTPRFVADYHSIRAPNKMLWKNLPWTKMPFSSGWVETKPNKRGPQSDWVFVAVYDSSVGFLDITPKRWKDSNQHKCKVPLCRKNNPLISFGGEFETTSTQFYPEWLQQV